MLLIYISRTRFVQAKGCCTYEKYQLLYVYIYYFINFYACRHGRFGVEFYRQLGISPFGALPYLSLYVNSLSEFLRAGIDISPRFLNFSYPEKKLFPKTSSKVLRFLIIIRSFGKIFASAVFILNFPAKAFRFNVQGICYLI